MLRTIIKILLLSVATSYYAYAKEGEVKNKINLAGEWQFCLDPDDKGVDQKWYNRKMRNKIKLPGSTNEAGYGKKLDLIPNLSKKVFQHLHQKFKYIGPAWYVKKINIPKTWQGKDIRLFLERVLWESRVFVNGQEVGMMDSLSTPHQHDLSKFLKPGEHTIAIRIDNRAKLNIGIGHAYTEETQSIWNGIIGRIELHARNRVHIDELKLFPNLKKSGVRVICHIENNTDKPVKKELILRAVPVNHSGNLPKALRTRVTVPTAGKEFELFYPMGDDYRKWSEFTPEFYKMKATIDEESLVESFGMREITINGTQFSVNGNKIFLRGTLECCIFPKTGYPKMTKSGWNKIFKTAKAYGLNHLRFHSWCPPEAAFDVADQVGFYLQVELPNWSFQMGKAKKVDKYFYSEGEKIFKNFANHPSFVFFSLGNELAGDIKAMDRYLDYFKEIEPRPLYTSTSFAFSPRGLLPGRADDFFITQRSKSGWLRGQGFLNQTRPNTVSDYSQGLSCIKIPLVSHEVGQYNVFPNLAEIPKYDGCLEPLGYHAIKNDLIKKGRLYEAAENTLNSGKLAVLLYKDDLERALRTKGQAGIQLLDLHDFTGQSTATIGILDSFWDSKGLIEPEKFRRFCSPVVPLIRMRKMVYLNNESFDADIELANFGGEALKQRTVYWKITDKSELTIAEKRFKMAVIATGNGIKLGSIHCSLIKVKKASELKVTVGIEGTDIANDWSIWVYPVNQQAVEGDVIVIRNFGSTLFNALKNGKKVLFLPDSSAIINSIFGRFIPVFWSPIHFKNQPGTLGTVINNQHPIFKEFPTATSTDWQWWELLANSYSVGTDDLGPEFRPIMRFVDKFNRNNQPSIIWEAKVGKGQLLVCSLDIESKPSKRIVAAQLKKVIFLYMNSADFKPQQRLTAQKLFDIFETRPYTVTVTKGTTHASYPVTNIYDNNPDTFWHNDWTDKKNRYPYHIEINLAKAVTVIGLDYTPRQVGKNGHIKKYKVVVKDESGKWKVVVSEGEFLEGNKHQQIRFKKPVKGSLVRFIALSGMDTSALITIAELKPIFDTATDMNDVSELGIIEGFNDVNK